MLRPGFETNDDNPALVTATNNDNSEKRKNSHRRCKYIKQI